jgi:hypothetical protein
MRGYIFENKIVCKPGSIPELYRFVDDTLRPQMLRAFPGSYAYSYVQGRHAKAPNIPVILEVCQNNLWMPRGFILDAQVVDDYARYIEDLMKEHGDRANDPLVEHALTLLKQRVLPRVAMVHGDLTFENIIIQDEGNMVFIDPGEHHKMFTPGMDRGKLLQSLVMRWEERDIIPRPWAEPAPWPEWATFIDWAFLVTHWVRLIRHWPELDIHAGFRSLEDLCPKVR